MQTVSIKSRTLSFAMTKKVLSISLMFLLLAATVGVQMNKHYCGDKLSRVSLLVKLVCGCGEMDDEEDCCRNESEMLQVEDDFTAFSNDFQENIAFVATVFVTLDLPLLDQDVDDNTAYLNYKPPLLHFDVPVLVQSFLI